MRIAVSRLRFPVPALGPGRRIGLWLHGCSIRFPGFISVDTWAHDAGHVPLSDVTERIAALAGEADGLTVSGGEPFDQPDALAAILAAWRELTDRSVLLFTGHEISRSEEHTSELQSLMRSSYAVFCSKKKTTPRC